MDRTHPASEFLHTLFTPNDEDQEGFIALWDDRSKRTELFGSPEFCAERAQEPTWQDHAFYGLCTRDFDAMNARAGSLSRDMAVLRGLKVECVAMVGLWLDLDVGDHGKGGKVYPPTPAEALDAVNDAVPLAATVVVQTCGADGGLHLLWLFDEPIEFEDTGERSRESLERLCLSYQSMARAGLEQHGWTCDSTADITRVFRLPGQNNTKHGTPKPVTWSVQGRRYALEELASVVPEGLVLRKPEVPGIAAPPGARFDLTSMSELHDNPDFMTFIETQRSNSEVFERNWSRRDRAGDLSQSGRDIRLANIMATQGVGAQRIVDVLRWHRSISPDGDPKHKADRYDYYARTVASASAYGIEARKVEEAVAIVEAESAAITTAMPRVTLLEKLNDALQLPDDLQIVNVTAIPSVHPESHIFTISFTDDQAIALSAQLLYTPKKFMDRLHWLTATPFPVLDTRGNRETSLWRSIIWLFATLAKQKNSAQDNALDQACAMMVESAVQLFFTVPGARDAGPHTPAWTELVLGGLPAQWIPRRGEDREPAILIRRSYLSREVRQTYEPTGAILDALGNVFDTVDGFEPVRSVAITREGVKMTRSGFGRIRLRAIEKHASQVEADRVRRAFK